MPCRAVIDHRELLTGAGIELELVQLETLEVTQEQAELIAEVVVSQNYAAGPDQMIKAVAKALLEGAAGTTATGDPRRQLEQELDEAIKASLRGSE